MDHERLIRKTWDRLGARPRPLTIKEAVAFLNVAGVKITHGQLRRWVTTGKVQPEHRCGSLYLLGKRSLETAAYVASGEGVPCQD